MVNFDIFASRYPNKQSNLPSFMQEGINTRFGIESVTKKKLDSVGYCEADFGKLYSSFEAPPRKKRRRRREVW